MPVPRNTIEVVGPDTLIGDDLARIRSEATGREIRYGRVAGPRASQLCRFRARDGRRMEGRGKTAAEHQRPVAVVADAGPGNGQALAKRFAAAGYAVALLARDADKVEWLVADVPNGKGYACDVGDAASVSAAFDRSRAELASRRSPFEG
jgi:hypothetical protein